MTQPKAAIRVARTILTAIQGPHHRTHMLFRDFIEAVLLSFSLNISFVEPCSLVRILDTCRGLALSHQRSSLLSSLVLGDINRLIESLWLGPRRPGRCVFAGPCLGDLPVHVLDGLQYPLAAVTTLIAIA